MIWNALLRISSLKYTYELVVLKLFSMLSFFTWSATLKYTYELVVLKLGFVIYCIDYEALKYTYELVVLKHHFATDLHFGSCLLNTLTN